MFKVGDEFFHIQENLNFMSRKKITMTDADGVEWYRYDKPPRSFKIERNTVVGIVRPVVEGRLTEDDDVYSRGEFTFLHCEIDGDNTATVVYDEENLATYVKSGEYYFRTEEEAKAKVQENIEKDTK
jgi:hypothetical protein